MGSSRAADMAGYIPKKIPTRTERLKLTTTDQALTIVCHSAKPLTTYDGDIEVKATIAVDAGAKPGDRELKGTVRYQACTQETCLFPANQAFSVLLKLAAQ